MKKLFSTLTVFLSVFVLARAQNASPYWSLAGNSNATSSSKLGTTNANHLRLFTNNLERMRISSSGNVGIGKTGPNAKLHLTSATGQDALRVQVNSETKLFVHRDGGVAIGANATPPANGLYVAGRVGIGTNTIAPTAQLHVNSTVDGQSPFQIQTIGTTQLLMNSKGQIGLGTPIQNGFYRLNVGNPPENTELYNCGIAVFGMIGLNTQSSSNYGRGIQSVATGENGWGILASSSKSFGIYASTGNPASFAGYFSGTVFSTGSYQASDEKLKQNISDVKNATAILSQLKPKNYNYKTEGSFAQINLPLGQQFGLLSQDVEKVLPGLVKKVHLDAAEHSPTNDVVSTAGLGKEALDFKAVNYTGLIPIMIQAMQEQEAKIEKQQQTIQQQQQEINTFKDRLTKLEAALGTGRNDLNNLPNAELTDTYLQQNQPNPFNQVTTFHYSIPTGSNAQILLYDSSGKLVKTLAAPADGQVQLNTRDLKPGTYVYSLLVNGKLAGSKQMILSK